MKTFLYGLVLLTFLYVITDYGFAKDGTLYNVLCYSDNTQTYVVEFTNRTLEAAEALVESGRAEGKDCFLEEVQ